MSAYKTRLAKRKTERRVIKFPSDGHPRHVCDETCEHYRSPLEQELSEKVREILKNVPARTRATIEGLSYVDVRIVCGGAIHISCWYCCLRPDHKGQCFSSNKQVYFTPETYG